MVFCRGCGAQIHESAPLCPKCGAPQEMSEPAERFQGPRSFGSAIAICFNRYFQFRGRAPRSEYWYFALFNSLITVAADILDAVWFGQQVKILGPLVGIALIVPNLAVWTRRMHDLDRTGWWWLLALVPIIGWIILLVWSCTRGTYGSNRYGADPLARLDGWVPASSTG